MRSEIKKIFDARIAEKFRTLPEVRKFLLTHERKEICIDNLCEQIQICERKLYSILFQAEDYKDTIHTVADMFCERALKKAEEDSISANERIRRMNEVDEPTQLIRDMVQQGLIVDSDKKDYQLGADSGQEAEVKKIIQG